MDEVELSRVILKRYLPFQLLHFLCKFLSLADGVFIVASARNKIGWCTLLGRIW